MNQYDFFKDKLHDYKVKVDKEKLWQDTAHAIPQRRKKRILLFFFTGCLLVSAWVGISLKSTWSHQVLTDTAVQPSPSWSGIIGEQSLSPKAHTEITEMASIDPHKSDSENQINKNRSNHNLQKSVASQNPYSQKSLIQKPHTISISEKELNGWSPQSTPASGSGQLNPIEENTFLAASAQRAATLPTEDPISDTPETPVAEEFQVAHLKPIDFLESWICPLAEADVHVDHTPVISSHDRRKTIYLQGIPAIGISTFNVKALNPESGEMKRLFDQSVRSLEHLTVTLNAGLPLSKGFSIEAGLGWNQWTIETKKQSRTYQSFTREGVTAIWIDENGVRQNVIGDINGTRIIDKTYIRFTQFQTIAAELTLRKMLWRKRHFSLDAYVKGSLIMSEQAEGSTYNTEKELWKFSGKENPYQLNSNLLFGGGVQAQYHINRYWAIRADLAYQPVSYQLQQGQQQIQLTHSAMLANVGLAYTLH